MTSNPNLSIERLQEMLERDFQPAPDPKHCTPLPNKHFSSPDIEEDFCPIPNTPKKTKDSKILCC